MSDPFADNCAQTRYLDKSANCNERKLQEEWWNEQINLYGQEIDYYVHGYSLSGHDFLYGEEPTAAFQAPKTIISVMNLNENTAVLQKFGLVSEDELTMYVSISGFHATYGETAEPKSDDVFALTEYATDRPNGRGPKFFQITDRVDEDVSEINALMGHYVWLVRAKRLDYSYEPGITIEQVMGQVYDDTFSGRLSGGENPETDPKTYSDEVDAFGDENVFDYDNYEDSNSDVYGGY